MNNHVLLILSMHRSGTSALTRVFSLLGAELPKSMYGKTDGNQRGHWESDVLVSSHDALLKKMKSDWSDWRPLLTDKFTAKKQASLKAGFAQEFAEEFDLSKPVIVMKDPRVCKFAQLYIEALSEAQHTVHPVIIVRNPLEVAGSLESRDGLSFSEGLLLWLSYMLEAERASRGLERAMTTYEAFLKKPVVETDKLVKALNCPLPYTAKEMSRQIKEYVSPALKRHKYKTEDVVLNSVSRGWVSQAYEALLLLRDAPKSEKAIKMLDSVRSEFLEAAPPLYKFLDAEKQSHQKAITQLKIEHGGEREQSQAAYEAGMAELEAKTKSLLASRDEAAAAMLQGRDEDMSKLQETLKAVISDLETKLHRALEEKHAAEAKFQERGMEHEALQGENIKIRNELKALSGQLQAASGEKSQLSQRVGLLTKEEAKLSGKIGAVLEDMEVLTQQIGAAKREKAALSKQVETISEEKAAVLKQVETISEEKAALSKQIETISEEKSALSKEIETISEEKSALSKEIETILNEKVALSDQLRTVSQKSVEQVEENQTLSARLKAHVQDITGLERSQAILAEKNAGLEALNFQMKRNLEDVQQGYEQLKAHADALSRKSENLETQLSAARVQSEARASEIEFMRENFGALRTELEGSITDLSSALGQRDAELGGAREREASLRGQLEAVLGSTSWKMTGGMRAVLNLLRGQKPAAISQDQAPPRLTFRDEDGMGG
jgi:hypothetical protein